MKYFLFLFGFLILIGFTATLFLIPQAFAEPVSHEEFMKTYQPKLDRVHDENLPPTKQSEIGIRFNDIFCHENKIHVLKLSGQNHIACVTPESAIKLVERGWGLMHRDDPHKGQAGAECTQWWIIHHSDAGIPLESTLIKTIRVTTNEFSNEFVVWEPVRIVDHVHNIITISSHGSFDDLQRDAIMENLSDIKYVLNVEHKNAACV